MTWNTFLEPYRSAGVFDAAFVERWGPGDWKPVKEDQIAAGKLHTQLISRITTQRLGYLDGVEKTALKSVYDLFEHTRSICDKHPEARHFQTIAWHVLNTHVRPFTAKWHPVSERGMLAALDTTDEFRAELEALQRKLRQFERLLSHLRDGEPPPADASERQSSRESAIANEMSRPVSSQIPVVRGGMDEGDAAKLNAAEKQAITTRRAHYGLDEAKTHTVALALSGGGIRSATFSLGVLVALAGRGLLPQFDYLSTVSGGGYLGSFLTAYLNTPSERPTETPIGLRANELPFQRDAGEAAALRHIRHHSKYLASGSFTDRLRMIAGQLYGMMLNGLGIVFITAAVAVIEFHLRRAQVLPMLWTRLAEFLALLPGGGWIATSPFRLLGGITAVWAVIALVLIRKGRTRQWWADSVLVLLGSGWLGLMAWMALGHTHRWLLAEHHWPLVSQPALLSVLGAIPVIASTFAGLAGKIFDRVKMVLGWLSAFAAPLFFFGVYLSIYQLAGSEPVLKVWGHGITSLELITAALAVVYFFVLNVNFTSPHRHYRKKLAEAYLIQPALNAQPGRPFEEAVELKLSKATAPGAPYHLINAALNVPGSKNPGMQGRLTDFFLFSPAFCGSPLTRYHETTAWEAKDGHLDLGTAMAISGAAAAPQMGLGTKRRLSFWLALLNVRLGYWLRDPAKSAGAFGGAPGLWFLLKEMRGSMDETAPWLYLSDGGHIENLGVYELLRRRCKYIVAVDGEQDERMTFAALTTLQRLAAIDLGVKIDVSLDDLRLNEQGLSRSHFRFCRIEYPDRQFGYLLYVKLSLTGNEGEFLRRYRLDEPAFPHHSTADQFFSEAQFEAYRSLGEHVGDKLFLRALVGDEMTTSTSVDLESWFTELGKRLLEPLKTPPASPGS